MNPTDRLRRRISQELRKIVPEGSRFPVSDAPVELEIEECDPESGTALIQLGGAEFEEASRFSGQIRRYLLLRIPELEHVSFKITELEPDKGPMSWADSTDIVSFQVDMNEPPTVFVSYRWQENDDWVDRFVADIHRNGVRVVYDKWVKNRGKWNSTDELINALLAALNACLAFVPIFTPGYLVRAGFVEGRPASDKHPDDGVVFDEFERSVLLAQYRQIETVAVLLEGNPRILPKPFTLKNVLDMRDPEAYKPQLNRFLHYMHEHRAVKNRGPRHGAVQGNHIWFDPNWGGS